MVRNLYRIYLYAVCIALLISATTATAVSLGLLLSITSLRGPYASPPDRSQVVQAVVAFVVVWVVTLLLGGLHYWLIRRDMATDPAAGGGAVRSYFLNVTQLFAVLTAIGTAAAGITQLGDRNNSPIYSFSTALATAGLFALLEWERRRTRAATEAAIVFQRLHHYAAQLVIVFIATPFWFQAIQDTALTILTRSGAYNPCFEYPGGFISCDPGSYYPLRQTVAQWGAALFVAACWAGYTAISRSDRHSRLRQVTHLLAFGYGLGFVVWGMIQLFESLLLMMMGEPHVPSDLSGVASALAILVFGGVVMLAYGWLYSREAPGLPSGVPAAGLIQVALVAVIFALPFWLGVRSVLSAVIEHNVSAGVYPNNYSNALSGAQLLAGLPFIFFTLYLNACTRQTGVNWPHRVFDLVMLASGVITSAGGLIVTLQALLSAMLGAPADNWQYTVWNGLVIQLVGGTMAAIFATVAVRSRYLSARPEPKPVETESVAANTQPVALMGAAARSPYETLEGILDALLAGRMTRDEAAARIRASEGMR
jgi:hypothetical protein